MFSLTLSPEVTLFAGFSTFASWRNQNRQENNPLKHSKISKACLVLKCKCSKGIYAEDCLRERERLSHANANLNAFWLQLCLKIGTLESSDDDG